MHYSDNTTNSASWQQFYVEESVNAPDDVVFISVNVLNDTSTGTGTINADASEFYEDAFAELPAVLPLVVGASLILVMGIIFKKK